MMKGSISIFLSLSALFIGILSGNANENGMMAVSYDTGVGTSLTDGTSKTESYDVAIRLVDGSLVGKHIVGLSIPLVSANGISNLTGWLSSTLNLSEDGVNSPDIAITSAEAADGWVDVMFDSPYEITADGVYAGYSFDISQLNNLNLRPVCLSSTVHSDGYFIHTSRTRKYIQWTSVNESASPVGSLSLRVYVEGMEPDAASIELYPLVSVAVGQTPLIPATLFCHGYNGIASIEYEYTIGDISGTSSFALDYPVEAVYNMPSQLVYLPLCPIDNTGEYDDVTVTVTSVNGQPNADPLPSATTTVNVYDFVPVHRPLVEEYTGTWCGNCPRGIASMELMKERYGSDFISLAYHNGDPMETTVAFPSAIQGYPDCWISRAKNTDPFFGDKRDDLYHFEEEWLARRIMPCTASVDVEAAFAGSDEDIVVATASVMAQQRFDDGRLAVALVLVADDLHSAEWSQQNYYAGTASTCAPELLEFANSPKVIKDLHFNDVVLMTYNLTGESANLPDEIEPLVAYSVTSSFDLNEAVSIAGASLVQDKSCLRIVAMVIDRVTGEIVNANQSAYLVSASEPEVTTSCDEIVSVRYYDFFGRELSPGHTGLCIKQTLFKNGNIVSRKCFVQ